ncbi:hypothetical protein Tco_1429382 [Tanacetum coccineum]
MIVGVSHDLRVSSKASSKGVGLRVADSHTGNHSEDDFTPLETIRRLLVVIGRRSHSGFEGEAFKPERRIVVVKDFTKVFPDDLSGLPPIRKIEFRIELVPEAMSVEKSPYCLTPSELEESSGQLKEL